MISADGTFVNFPLKFAVNVNSIINFSLIPKVSSTVGKRWKLLWEKCGSKYGKREKSVQKGGKTVKISKNGIANKPETKNSKTKFH